MTIVPTPKILEALRLEVAEAAQLEAMSLQAANFTAKIHKAFKKQSILAKQRLALAEAGKYELR